MKNILFPTDFSKTSKNAAQFATEIAKKCEGNIAIVNVYAIAIYEPNMPSEILATAYVEAEKSSKENLEIIKNEIENSVTDKVRVKEYSLQGLVVDEIIDFSKTHKAGLIIMGTTGASGMLEKMIGSNTTRVIEEASCPVLAVPDKAKYKDIKNIVYASDLNGTEEKELKKLTEFAAMNDAKITVVHVCDRTDALYLKEKDKLYKEVAESINYSKVEFELITDDDVMEGIDKYISQNKANIDVIAMSTHKRGLLGRLFGSSLTKEMVYHTHIPVFALHQK